MCCIVVSICRNGYYNTQRKYKTYKNRAVCPFYQVASSAASKNVAFGKSIDGRLGPRFHNNITEFSPATLCAAKIKSSEYHYNRVLLEYF